jgi:hypothetical protein
MQRILASVRRGVRLDGLVRRCRGRGERRVGGIENGRPAVRTPRRGCEWLALLRPSGHGLMLKRRELARVQRDLLRARGVTLA